jgi:hypothetical protein
VRGTIADPKQAGCSISDTAVTSAIFSERGKKMEMALSGVQLLEKSSSAVQRFW